MGLEYVVLEHSAHTGYCGGLPARRGMPFLWLVQGWLLGWRAVEGKRPRRYHSNTNTYPVGGLFHIVEARKPATRSFSLQRLLLAPNDVRYRKRHQMAKNEKYFFLLDVGKVLFIIHYSSLLPCRQRLIVKYAYNT